MTRTEILTVPDEIKGRLWGAAAHDRNLARREWVERAVLAGYTLEQAAEALDMRPATLNGLYRDAVFRLRPPAPKPAEKPAREKSVWTRDRGNSGSGPHVDRVSLCRLPWDEAEITPDPRHETTPRFSLVRTAPAMSRVDVVIAAIREVASA